VSTAPDTPPAAPPADEPYNWAPAQRVALGAAAVGIAAYVILGVVNMGIDHEHGLRQFFLSYLTGFVYWSGITLGAMALLMIHYLAKSSWGRLLNRPLEAASRCLPLILALFIPLAIATTMGKDSPYWWSDPHAAHASDAHDEEKAEPKDGEPPPSAADVKRQERIEYGKKKIEERVHEEREAREHGTWGFLSTPGFVICGIAYFAVWGGLIFFLNKWGRDTIDAGDDRERIEAALKKASNLSGPGLILYAITLTAAVSQWVMSLEPSWASTMFPVVYAVNQLLAGLTFCVAIFLTLAERPPLSRVLRPKFQIDMGSLMLALTLFWSYTSFSQLMLVWIGNLPEEIPFFLKRSNPPMENGWWWVSAALIVFNFACPFILLLFRDVKLHKKRLRAVALWLLVMYFINAIWWVEPAVPHEGNFPYWLMDIASVIGLGGVWGLVFLWQLKQRPILPFNQVYMLPEGHDHGQH
jgi:hypothetical protein